jgi:hypothetical protein
MVSESFGGTCPTWLISKLASFLPSLPSVASVSGVATNKLAPQKQKLDCSETQNPLPGPCKGLCTFPLKLRPHRDGNDARLSVPNPTGGLADRIREAGQ